MKVYLAGAIAGCTDEQANGWRQHVIASLPGVVCLDPMTRDYRGIEDANVQAIVDGDLRDIDSCDVVLVMAHQPSWGTAMETYYAWAIASKIVLVVCGSGRVSPWLRAHSTWVAETLDQAIERLRLLQQTIDRMPPLPTRND